MKQNCLSVFWGSSQCNDKPNTFCTSRPELVFNPVALSRHTEQSLVCEHCSIDLHKSVMCLSKIFLTEIYIELFKVISNLIQFAPCNIQIQKCLPAPAPTAVPACSVLSAVKPIALKCQTHLSCHELSHIDVIVQKLILLSEACF